MMGAQLVDFINIATGYGYDYNSDGHYDLCKLTKGGSGDVMLYHNPELGHIDEIRTRFIIINNPSTNPSTNISTRST
jgi:hypothetical protein